jgi:selenocysteine lyase/cysteine desulfurase
MQRYAAYLKTGSLVGNDPYIGEMWSEIRGLFARMTGADADEIGLVHCTKAGEQIAIDAVDDIKKGGNIVTNDLHFSGSLHNLTGLKKAGRDVRIVKARDWKVPVEDMAAAIDDNTSLVTITLVSNINGHLADAKEIAGIAHKHGALIYVDIIQAAGAVPLDLHDMGVDMAACSSYKWLYGVFGAGFIYVRKDLQGKRLPDRLYPGRVGYNYAPWTNDPEQDKDEIVIAPKDDASRYEPGHVNYMGYCMVYEGLKFLEKIGVANALEHSVTLNQRLREKLDPKKYTCISPDIARTPIITFLIKEPTGLSDKLKAAKISVSMSGNRIRVSPALFNTETDIDTIATVMNGHG